MRLFWRKLGRGLVLAVVMLTSYVLLVLALFVFAPLPRLQRRARNFLFRTWSRLCLRIIGGRLVVEGEPPSAPFFLVSNHLSYVDILVLSSQLEAYFIAKAEVRGWPVFGALTRAVGTIFIDRELRRDVVRVNRKIAAVLERGYGVVLFPEGTSSQGYDVSSFRSSLLEFPVQESLPVHVAAVRYRTDTGEIPANLSLCWWGDAAFLPHFSQLLGVGGFEAHVRFVEGTTRCGDRKELARRLRALVTANFTPVVDYEERALETGLSKSGSRLV